ncbi:MAG: hypothetical protein KC503_27240 [Myxococcales bacterium]|nr:hypothetical protein [Myxococcales bacterium]
MSLSLRPSLVALLSCALLSLAACENNGNTNPDARDGLGEGVTPPPLEGGADALSGRLGSPCNVADGSGCVDGTTCLDVGLGVGVCVIPGCTIEDIETPGREDDCPPGAACARVPIRLSDGTTRVETYCLRTCVPDPDRNSCAESSNNGQLACDPASVLFTGHAEVCLFPACKGAGDCGNNLTDYRCDDKTKTCFGVGKPNVPVGSPCKVATDCGPDQFCLAEREIGGTTKVSGGYCTIVGCKHAPMADPQGPWHCPANSRCYSLGRSEAVSLCLATGGCDPKAAPEKDGCRDEAAVGQYQCLEVGGTGVCWLEI